MLLAGPDGRIAGSVSGGCVEGAAYEEIERARRDGVSRVIRYGISDEQAWDVGLACGGTIDVLVEPVIPAEIVLAGEDIDHGRAVVTPLPADSPGPAFGPHEPGAGEPTATPLIVTRGRLAAAARSVRLRSTPSSSGPASTRSRAGPHGPSSWPVGRCSSRRSRSGPRLVVVGAVQVAIPLVALARRARLRDGGHRRAAGIRDAASGSRWSTGSSSAGRTRSPTRSVLGPSDAVAVLTHDVKFDEPAIVAALQRGCRYVGAVGSRKTQADRRDRLMAAGVTADELGRLRGPIGLDLGGRAPAETALAIMAEIVADRHGGSGRPMLELAAARA